MPVIFSVIFRIHSVMLSICCVMGIICSVIVIIHSVIFTISSAVLWISCLWFIIQPIPTVILELLFHPLDSLRHSCNSACDVHNCFCDPNKVFCHPYYYANELPIFLMTSSVFVVELVNNDSNYNTLLLFFCPESPRSEWCKRLVGCLIVQDVWVWVKIPIQGMFFNVSIDSQ